MKRYFKNLLTAICGNNPYQMELDRVRDEYRKTAENVRLLQTRYDAIRGRYESTRGLLKEWERILREYKERLNSCQALIENLRTHCTEKDELIGQVDKDYRRQLENFEKRIADYSVEVASLQKKLERQTKPRKKKQP